MNNSGEQRNLALKRKRGLDVKRACRKARKEFHERKKSEIKQEFEVVIIGILECLPRAAAGGEDEIRVESFDEYEFPVQSARLRSAWQKLCEHFDEQGKEDELLLRIAEELQNNYRIDCEREFSDEHELVALRISCRYEN